MINAYNAKTVENATIATKTLYMSLLYFSVLIHDNLIEQLTALHSLGGRVRFNAIRVK